VNSYNEYDYMYDEKYVQPSWVILACQGWCKYNMHYVHILSTRKTEGGILEHTFLCPLCKQEHTSLQHGF
jgi:hypothetical protein